MGPYGRLGTIGLIVPPRTNETLLYEMMRVVPDGVSWCVSTLGLREHDLHEYATALAAVERCTEELVERGAGAIAFAGIPLSTSQGTRYHEQLAARIADASGHAVPVTTDLAACLAALAAFGAGRVTVISNYQNDVLQRLVGALEESGLAVATTRGIHLTLAEQITGATFDTAFELATEAFREDQTTDAILLACPQWPLVGNIERIEAATSRPVVTQLQAIAWWALHALDLDPTVPACGRLLAADGPAW
jgi:maleate isomerase